MKKVTIVLTILLLAVVGELFAQGVTTSSLNGKVTDNTGEPLPGANVIATHQPTGTNYGVVTDFDGFYRINNMRVGGPYKVVITYVGFNEFLEENLFLQLGESEKINVQMRESTNDLDEVIVTAQRNGVFDSGKTGSETTVTQREINTIPNTSRSVAEFVRITPQAQLSEGDDGFSISIAGQNNRFNGIYIDGAVNNDVFGLAGSGTNGGQTGINPFSIDAIETFQINLAPFDVRQSGFAGGAINAITRSGSNEWEGSAYTFFKNENLVGKTPIDLVGEDEERENINEFTASTIGLRVGGPIVKDKLFFFANYERVDNETPAPFNISNYRGNSTREDLIGLRQTILDRYQYDIGGFENNASTLLGNTFTVRLDWNINDNNQIFLKNNYVKSENLEGRRSTNGTINFSNGSELFESTANTTTLEWNSTIGNKFSNNMIIGYSRVRDDRDPSGNPFPTVFLDDGDGGINLGAERFSTANLLDQDVFTFANNFSIFSGRHTVTIGTQNEYASTKNLFFRNNFGRYRYFDVFDDDTEEFIQSGVTSFLNNEATSRYDYNYSLIPGGGIGDESTGAAEFSRFMLGLYVQDEVQMSDNFKLTAGLRIDIPYWEEGIVNDDFNNTTIPLLEAVGKNLKGAQVGKSIKPRAHVAPRIGFNWDVNGNNTTQLRGGLGIFTSRVPLVWAGGTYNNNGVTQGVSDNRDFDDPIFFEPDVNSQPRHLEPGADELGGQVDLFAPNTRLPQIMKYNLAIDQKLPLWGLIISADLLYQDNITQLQYENLNIRGREQNLDNGPDNRPRYNLFNTIDSRYNSGIFLASNTGEGYSYNAAFTLAKPFSNGFQGSISYSYGESKNIFDATSSQNSSQWRNQVTVNGKNSNLPIARSNFAAGHRIISNISYEFKWNKNIKTTVGLVYEGSQTRPFSYIYGNEDNQRILNDAFSDNALIYIPNNDSEIRFNGNTSEQAEQWEIFNDYIENDDYLSGRRGQYAERNGSRGPWNHIFDFRFIQDFSISIGGQKQGLQFTADILNFGNFLNKNWGVRKFVSGEVQLLDVVAFDSDTPIFSINQNVIDDVEQIDDFGNQSSRWQMQIGLRYLFN
ncbi:carboxypeptidase regulatory-like domain-containing protein [Aquimarina sp. ERC-38]|uniref:TonB-dependent receptor n=1 Tax=Aquimarina sp. ERC-38 TaxID=2949996 RepID=UPI0022478390|nr:TonB-dependent receptor [Aquimarina sp. ERC-38]UZO82123.1 carboxypeptidase regulatory-like domain-containing protein [Aquimarina sp. ERC-38]